MRTSRFSEPQVVEALKRAEAGVPVKDVCRELEVSPAMFYQWRSKYGGLEASDLKRMKELEEENRRLKQMFAELSLDHKVLKDVVEKNLDPTASTGPCDVCDACTRAERTPSLSGRRSRSLGETVQG